MKDFAIWISLFTIALQLVNRHMLKRRERIARVRRRLLDANGQSIDLEQVGFTNGGCFDFRNKPAGSLHGGERIVPLRERRSTFWNQR